MRTLYSLIALCIFCSSCYKQQQDVPVITVPDSTVVVQKLYKVKAKEVYDNIIRYFSLTGTNLFRENYPVQGGDPRAAYFWPHTGLFTAATLLKSVGYNDPSFKKVFDGMNDYWDPNRTPVGFQSSPLQYGSSDRYYDDNGTAGNDLIRAFEVTGDASFLDKAENCLLFTMSGESQDAGGGLFWSEPYRMNNVNHPYTIKAANSTAFAITLALKIYQLKPKQQYLDFAMRLYNWNKAHMQDPADKNYWNDVAVKDGTINKTKWAYNSGEMITNGCLLYQATNNMAYLNDARETAKASYDYFTRTFRDQGRFFPSTDPWFTAILFRGYLDLYAIDKKADYINTIIKNMDYAWAHARATDGFFYEDMAGEYQGRSFWLLTQAAMVEILTRISKFKGE